ncbi:MAG: hypothetical protein KY410_00665 [Proteobacteria bacterium]|nr:hypothetical protein [Pseudomonadota bacterium]
MTLKNSETMITRVRTNLLKKLSAVVAVVLMLHTQAAWACANLGSEHAAPAPCCTEHVDMATDRMSDCDDPSSEALCAKPFAHSASLVLSQVHDDAQDNDADTNDGGDGSGLSTAIVFADAATVFARLDLSPHVADPYETLAPARLTYLKTLRLRI